MVHFLRQLQAFYQLEVVECSWSVLEDFIEKRTGDLDALIHAHRIYLERLTRKVLLSGGKRDKEVRSLFHELLDTHRGSALMSRKYC
jgi:gamma-tubulin complex component 3